MSSSDETDEIKELEREMKRIDHIGENPRACVPCKIILLVCIFLVVISAVFFALWRMSHSGRFSEEKMNQENLLPSETISPEEEEHIMNELREAVANGEGRQATGTPAEVLEETPQNPELAP